MTDIVAPRDNNLVPGVVVANASSTTEPLVIYGDATTHALYVHIAGGSFIDDSAFTPGATSVTPVAFLADETATDSVDEGDAGAARMTLARKQITASEFKEDTAHADGDYGSQVLAVRNDSNAALAGTDLDYIPLSTDGVGALRVGGSVASDAVDSGNPVKTGGLATNANITSVANLDRVNSVHDLQGKQIIRLNAVRELEVHQHTEIASSSSETTILTAGAAGVFHDVTHIILTNQTATAVNVTIKDATAGTTRMIVALAASGGATLSFPIPVTQAASANNWTATLSSAAVTVDIFIQAVKNV